MDDVPGAEDDGAEADGGAGGGYGVVEVGDRDMLGGGNRMVLMDYGGCCNVACWEVWTMVGLVVEAARDIGTNLPCPR